MTRTEDTLAELKQVVFDHKLEMLAQRSGVHRDRIRRILRAEQQVVRDLIALEKAGAELRAERAAQTAT